MSSITQAEEQKYSKCPKCLMRRLKETKRNGTIKHDCISCGYLMVWTERMSTLEIQMLNRDKPVTYVYTRSQASTD